MAQAAHPPIPRLVAVSDLDVVKFRVRAGDPATVDSLVRTPGSWAAIVLQFHSNVVLDGHMRVTAAVRLGFTHIWAVDAPPGVDPFLAAVQAVTRNEPRLSRAEAREAATTLEDAHHDWTEWRIADSAGCSETVVRTIRRARKAAAALAAQKAEQANEDAAAEGGNPTGSAAAAVGPQAAGDPVPPRPGDDGPPTRTNDPANEPAESEETVAQRTGTEGAAPEDVPPTPSPSPLVRPLLPGAAPRSSPAPGGCAPAPHAAAAPGGEPPEPDTAIDPATRVTTARGIDDPTGDDPRAGVRTPAETPAGRTAADSVGRNDRPRLVRLLRTVLELMRQVFTHRTRPQQARSRAAEPPRRRRRCTGRGSGVAAAGRRHAGVLAVAHARRDRLRRMDQHRGRGERDRTQPIGRIHSHESAHGVPDTSAPARARAGLT